MWSNKTTQTLYRLIIVTVKQRFRHSLFLQLQEFAQLPRRPPPRSRMYTGASVLATRQTLPTSSKLTSLSMYDRRNDTTQCM